MSERQSESRQDQPFPEEMDTQELLMEAAVRVLEEEGMSGLTLRNVAAKADKNRGLLHYYFESKHDLLVSLLDHILEGTERLIGIDETDKPTAQLSTALRFHAYGPGGLDEAGRHYYSAILQLQALAVNDPAIRERFARNHQFVVDLIAEIIEDGISEGDFREVNAHELAIYFATLTDGARHYDLATGGTEARQIALDQVDRIVDEQLKRVGP